MAPAAARLALAAGFPALLAGEALAQAKPVQLPSSVEVGRGLALANSCQDRDGYTLCSPYYPIGATFREILCVHYGSDLNRHPIARCVYKGARVEFRARRGTTFQDWGDGAIDLIYNGDLWLPNEN